MRAIFRSVIVILAVFYMSPSGFADDTIREAQKILQSDGYYRGKLDGVWGSQTAASVRRFQVANDLQPTGELNPDTVKKLGIVLPPAVPRHKALVDLYKGGPMLTASPQVQVETIKKAKDALRLLGFYKGKINTEPGPDLTAAIKAFQQNSRYRQTGRLDKTTLQALDLIP